MIKFSWKKINDKFDWNAYSVLEYFYLKQEIDIPSFLNRKIPEKVKRAAILPYDSGPCFLIHPNKALKSINTPNHLYIYLELASKRNIFDYSIRRARHLSLALVDEYMLELVKINPMLKIENGNVYFKYEQE